MRNVHKLLALLLSLAMVFALGVTAAAEDVTATPVPISAPEEAPEATAAPGEIVILYTNDVHTYINKTLGYPSIAALKKELGHIQSVEVQDRTYTIQAEVDRPDNSEVVVLCVPKGKMKALQRTYGDFLIK